MPSFAFIYPTVWPQYTNVTDRQDMQTVRRQFIGRQLIARQLIGDSLPGGI